MTDMITRILREHVHQGLNQAFSPVSSVMNCKGPKESGCGKAAQVAVMIDTGGDEGAIASVYLCPRCAPEALEELAQGLRKSADQHDMEEQGVAGGHN